MLSRLIAYLRGIMRRRSIAKEVDAELQFHLEQEIAANIASGLSPGEAKRRALRDLGGLTQTRESVREVRTAWFDTLWQDLRFVARRLRREPGFTLVAILTLTLAVGANTAILGVADAILFRPLPYSDPDHVFVIEILDRSRGGLSTMTPYSFIDAINNIQGHISKVGMADSGSAVMEATPDGPQYVPTLGVTSGYFGILGITPALGRIFDPQDAGREGRSAMLSYSAWQQRFAGDPAIITKPVTIGSRTFDIVGVMPPDFVYPTLFAGKPEIITETKPIAPGTRGGAIHSIVRVAPGVSRERAQTEIDAAVAGISATIPNFQDHSPVLVDVRSVLYGRFDAPMMRFLLASAGLVLLIGCANLANMLLVRGHRHTRETAMRMALGAGRRRLIGPIVLESIIIGLVSGGLAIAATRMVFDILLRQIPPNLYGTAPIGINPRVAIISLVLSLISALAFAVVPAWRASRLDVLALLQGRSAASNSSAWLGRPLVVAQVALSLIAVFGAVVATRAFVAILNTPLGFSADGVVRMTVSPPRSAVVNPSQVVSVSPGRIEVADPPPPPTDPSVFYVRVVEALRDHPGVLSAGASTGLPLGGQAAYSSANLPGATERSGVGMEFVLPGFFETIGMSLRDGRLMTWDDLRDDPGSAVVNETAARTLFGGANPIGRMFISDDRLKRQFHVVGVVGDARQFLNSPETPRAYVFPAGGGRLDPVLRLRTRNDASLADIKAALRAVAPDSTVTVEWWADSIRNTNSYRNPRFQTIVLGTFGVLALMLTAIGVFGVVNYLVISRTREMGVRLALGASPGSLIIFVLKSAFVPVIIGLATGILGIRWLRPIAETQLTKVDTHDPGTLAIAAIAVALATLIAAYFPARRASSIDPVNALRTD